VVILLMLHLRRNVVNTLKKTKINTDKEFFEEGDFILIQGSVMNKKLQRYAD